jgi:molybdopterin-binding protein
VRSVEASGVMGVDKIDCGPYVVTSLISSQAIRDLGLSPGNEAVAIVEATSIIINRDQQKA